MHRRDILKLSSLAGAGLLGGIAARASAANVATTPGRGDLAIYNAKVITLDEKRPAASAVLVRGGRIAIVGTDKEVRAAAHGVNELDGRGRALIPGFIDNHCHVEDACVVADHQPTLRGTPTIAAMIDKVRARAATIPKGEWVLMQASPADFPAKVAEKRWLGREDLDAATTDHPVMVLLGIHASIMNTAAWKKVGYWQPGNDRNVKWKDGSPRLGSVIHRDASGHPIGLATEVWDFRPGYSVETYKGSMRKHFADWFLAKGLTSITTIQDTAPNEFLALQELQAEGGLPCRLRVYPVVPHAVALQDIVRSGFRSGFGSEMFRFGGIKLFVDGISHDYLGKQVEDVKWEADHLTDTVTQCQRNGLQLILHVVTATGMELALSSLERATKAVATPSLRHRIDHLTPTDDAQIARAKRLGVTFGITAPQSRPDSAAGEAAYRRRHRYRTLADQDVAIAVLDAAGPGGNYHPMRGIANMMVPLGSGGVVPAGETLSFEQGLKLWTVAAARNSFEEADKGSIEVGKLGDFAVLNGDPRNRSPLEIYDIGTDATIVGGHVVYGS
jgi:predicted amidohydrolase YtcJ